MCTLPQFRHISLSKARCVQVVKWWIWAILHSVSWYFLSSLTGSRVSQSEELWSPSSQKSLARYRHYSLENSSREYVFRGCVQIGNLWLSALIERMSVWMHTLSHASSSDRSCSIMWSVGLSPLKWHMASVRLCTLGRREKLRADTALCQLSLCVLCDVTMFFFLISVSTA